MRRILRALMVVAVCLFASACSAAADEVGSSDPAPIEASEVVYGKIRSANGNEITVAILDYSADAQGGAGGGSADAPSGEGEQRMPPTGDDAQRVPPSGEGEQRSERRGEAIAGQFGGAVGGEWSASGFAGMLAGMGGGMGAASGASNYTLTGEDATFTIPVTAEITTGEGQNARTIRFTQLSYKNVVKMSFDEAGNMIALQVLE